VIYDEPLELLESLRRLQEPEPQDLLGIEGDLAPMEQIARGRRRRLVKNRPTRAQIQAPKPQRTPKSQLLESQDALTVIEWIDRLRNHLKRNDSEAAARTALRLGRIFERMLVRPFEPNVKRGRATVAGGRQGHRKVFGDRPKVWAIWQQQCDSLRREHPEWKWSKIRLIVAHKNGISSGYVKKRCKDLRRIL
jgi:hypothetical protein